MSSDDYTFDGPTWQTRLDADMPRVVEDASHPDLRAAWIKGE